MTKAKILIITALLYSLLCISIIGIELVLFGHIVVRYFIVAGFLYILRMYFFNEFPEREPNAVATIENLFTWFSKKRQIRKYVITVCILMLATAFTLYKLFTGENVILAALLNALFPQGGHQLGVLLTWFLAFVNVTILFVGLPQKQGK